MAWPSVAPETENHLPTSAKLAALERNPRAATNALAQAPTEVRE